MPEALILLLLLVVGGAVWWVQRWSSHALAASRIPDLMAQRHVRVIRVESITPLWTRILPWALSVGGFLLALAYVPLGRALCAAIGFLLFVVGGIVSSTVVARRTIKIEAQLAVAIDHVVTSLHAGVGIVDALATAERDARAPLKPHLSHFLMRVRLGDDPPEVCRDMAEVLPLESFRLFYYALGVQWEGGGNLAPTLATTGRFIRDRVELGRRIRARTTEARFSVLAILGLTYFLSLLMWNVDPARVEGFLRTSLGEAAVAGSIVLQALGAAWVARISRVQY